MAQLLKLQNDIVTLKVELTPTQRVIFTLQFHENGTFKSEHLWDGGLGDLGLTGTFGSRSAPPDETALGLPEPLLKTLSQGWNNHGIDQRCLWIHLVQPYGLLRFLPWERLLNVLETPVLMLPDFIFPPPQESYALLDVVICGSAPLDSERGDAHEGMIDAINAIVRGVDRPLRLHIFTDDDVSAPLKLLNIAHPVILHERAPYNLQSTSSLSSDVQQNSTLRSPWLLWMREALKPYSADVVHFVCHGYLSGGHGALLFAQSPLGRTENFLSGPVGAVELTNFLTQIGAWATVFNSPRDNHDMLGLRALSDEIAQTLPGPMMLFDSSKAPYTVLENGYRFIHSPSPQSPPENHNALYIYCQPYLLTRGAPLNSDTPLGNEVDSRIRLYSRNNEQRDSARASYSKRYGSAPNGVDRGESISPVSAATERLSEQVQLHYQQVLRDEVVPASIANKDMSIALDTLDRFRHAVGQIEQRRIQSELDNLLDKIEQPVSTKKLPDAVKQELALEKVEDFVRVTEYERQVAHLAESTDEWIENLHSRIQQVEGVLIENLSLINHTSKESAAAYLSEQVERTREMATSTETLIVDIDDESRKE